MDTGAQWLQETITIAKFSIDVAQNFHGIDHFILNKVYPARLVLLIEQLPHTLSLTFMYEHRTSDSIGGCVNTNISV